MKNLSLAQKQSRAFNVFRTIAILAIICTVVLTLLLWVEGTVPTDESAKQSDAVADSIKDKGKYQTSDDPTLLGIRFNGHKEPYFCVGDTEKIDVVFYPKTTSSKQLLYSSDDESVCSVDENGIATYHSFGTTVIRIQSAIYPEISTFAQVWCSGYHADENVERLSVCGNDASQTFQNGIYCASSFKPVFQDQNGRIISAGDITISSSDETKLYVYNDTFYGLSVGCVNLHVDCPKANLSQDLNFEVLQSNNIVPTGYVFKSQKVEVIRTKPFFPIDNIESALPQGADISMFSFSTADETIARCEPLYIYPLKLGITTVIITPYANPSVQYTFEIEIVDPTPITIKISGNGIASTGNKTRYTAYGLTEDGFSSRLEDVIWEVDGKYATISNDGILIANRFGYVTLRARSKQDPSVYDEVRVRVMLWETFNLFIRKMIGHFGAFAVLGIGLTAIYFLLVRPRQLYFPLALSTGFLISTMSEIFQLPIFVPDRNSSWIDVLLDTCGVAVGIVFATLIIVIALAITKALSKTTYSRVKRAIRTLDCRTLLLSSQKTKLLFDAQEYVRNR